MYRVDLVDARDAVARPRRDRGVRAEVRLERVCVDRAAEAVRALRQDREAIPAVGEEAVHGDAIRAGRGDRRPVDADRRRVDAIARAGARFLRGWPADAPRPKVGSGLRPLTPDGLPVIGRLPRTMGVWVASGHSMLGVTLGPASGAALAAAITGESPDVLRPFDPARFQ